MTDPIVEEVRRVRDAHAASFDYDLDAIFRDIKEQEKKSGRKFASFPSRKGNAEPGAAVDVGGDGGSQTVDAVLAKPSRYGF